MPLVMRTWRFLKLRVMFRKASEFLIVFGTITGLRFSEVRVVFSLWVPRVLWVVSASA